MNLSQVIRAIEKTAAQQPNVQAVVRNDVFRLNACPVSKYGAVAWLQGEHRTSEDGTLMQYAFTLFYVDRLTANRSNEVEVQSVGMETLQNILMALQGMGVFVSGDYTFRTFNQRFTDECAGVFCTLVLETAKDGLCAEEYEALGLGDFNLDYNEDFYVWEWKMEEKTVFFI